MCINNEFLFSYKKLDNQKNKAFFSGNYMQHIDEVKIRKYGEKHFKEKDNAKKYMFSFETRSMNLMRKYYFLSNKMTIY